MRLHKISDEDTRLTDAQGRVIGIVTQGLNDICFDNTKMFDWARQGHMPRYRVHPLNDDAWLAGTIIHECLENITIRDNDWRDCSAADKAAHPNWKISCEIRADYFQYMVDAYKHARNKGYHIPRDIATKHRQKLKTIPDLAARRAQRLAMA